MNSPTPPRRWWHPAPFELSALNLFIARLGFAVLIFANTIWHTSRLTTQDNPNGIAHYIDLTWLGHHPPGLVAKGIVAAGLALYVLGIAPALGLLPMMFYSVTIGTLLLSQGEIQHSWQLVSLIGCTQLAAYVALGRRGLRPGVELQRLVHYWASTMLAACYVICAFVKLVNSDGTWLWRSPLITVQMMKSNWQTYYSTFEQPPAWLAQLTQFFVDYPWAARVFFGTGFFLELFTFVVLLGRRTAFWYGLALCSLHVGISFVMGLDFWEHVFAILVLLVVPNLIHAFRRKAA